MNERTKTGLEILQVAVGLGVLGDVLLRQTPWGLNVLLFNLAFAAGLLLLLRRHAPERLTGQTYALLGALVFFASMFVWRDAIELRVADTFAIVAILGVLFLPTLKISAKVGGLFQYAVGVVWAALNAAFASWALLGVDIRWSQLPATGGRRHAFAVLRGVVIALPLLLIFGGLFMAADAVYEGWIKSVLNIDFANLISHGLLFALFAWLTAGYFRGSIFAGAAAAADASPSTISAEASETADSKVDQFRTESGEHPVTLPDNKTVVEHINTPDAPDVESSSDAAKAETPAAAPKAAWSWAQIDNSIVPGFTLGAVEVGIILGLMNLLFLSFVIVQVPYLFGGMDLVQNTPDFKLAEYARRGFGELVAVSALILPVLLIGQWLIKKEARSAQNLFRVLAGVQIVLLFVIMASAVQRLVLLTGNLGYGMTTIRLYPLIFMSWLAIVFVWFAATVLRGSRQYFAIGALWSAIFILGGTHVLNPDAFIVRTNLALMRQGRSFDTDYNASLSADAMPALLEGLPMIAGDQRPLVIHRLRGQCWWWADSDLRSWNISRAHAASVLRSNETISNEIGECTHPATDLEEKAE